jgi:amino acid transporter
VNAASRVGYALGRVRILPDQLASVHRSWRTPWIAAAFICLLGIAIALILGYGLDGPGDALNFLVAIGVPMARASSAKRTPSPLVRSQSINSMGTP